MHCICSINILFIAEQGAIKVLPDYDRLLSTRLIQIYMVIEMLRTIGKSGNGPLEFLSPGDMTAYDDKIYIIDQKNYRVTGSSPPASYKYTWSLKNEKPLR